MLSINELPDWVLNLELDDLNFIKKIILCSGSLKELAKVYDISYPTVRARFDKLIEKIKLYDSKKDDYYIDKIKSLAIDGKIDLETAKILINEYRRIGKNENK